MPLDNLDVRLGIGKAIDWQQMIDNCYSGGRAPRQADPEDIPGGQAPNWKADDTRSTWMRQKHSSKAWQVWTGSSC